MEDGRSIKDKSIQIQARPKEMQQGLMAVGKGGTEEIGKAGLAAKGERPCQRTG
jgi:hypothetical protein